jgi:Dyp-type peroxidase family
MQGSGPTLDLDDIQGDILVGLQKNAELFLFFRIEDVPGFKRRLRRDIVGQLTGTRFALERRSAVRHTRPLVAGPVIGNRRGLQRHRAFRHGRELPRRPSPAWVGVNLGFTHRGMTRLLGAGRPRLDPAFERGADAPATLAALNDPPLPTWLPQFRAADIDGVFLVTGPDDRHVRRQGDTVLGMLGAAIRLIYAETGQVRPGAQRGHEHFGFADGISQPGIRGLTPRSQPGRAPNQGLPGQDMVWPGEFVAGYPAQRADNLRAGPVVPLPAAWVRNGSYMVFRRLEQLVPEFHRFIAARAAALGITPDLLGARLFGRWSSGAPLERAPLRDDVNLANDRMRNNDFEYRDDPFQRRCPYAAHIRKSYPRDDPPEGEAAMQTHRILRAGITFGPEVQPGETETVHSRGLMFVCYQIDIARQFEFIQSRFANDPGFVSGKRRPDDAGPVTPGFDMIIGQAPGNGPRQMDEPVPNYPSGNRRTSIEMPEQFVRLTAAGYFFMPSLSALRIVLT